jgi:hypothetical protein
MANKWETIFGISPEEAEEIQAFADAREEANWEEIEREWVNQ